VDDRSLYIVLLAILWYFARSGTVSAKSPESGTVPTREEVSSEYKWKLQDIYPSDADWEHDYQDLKSTLPTLTDFKGKLASSAQMLYNCLRLRDELEQKFGKLFVYARMHQDEDTANPVYQALADRAAGLSAEVSAAAAFINPELLSIPAAQLADYRRQEPELAVYSHYFDELLRMKDHFLSPSEEELLAQASEILRAPETIRGMLTNADIKFPQIRNEAGENIELSEGRFYKLITSPDRQVRKDAFTGLLGTYKQFENTYGAALNSSVKKDVFFARVKKFDHALHAALYPDNIPVHVYDNVIATINHNLAPLHRYMSLKKKALGYSELQLYDLYAPLTPAQETPIDYDEATTIVKEGLSPLGDEYTDILQTGFTSGWVDIYENRGKRKGAYAWGAYGTHPYVLLNYNHTLRDVMTLAHEMGHAIHSYYSHKHQPFQYADYTIFCAEVASTTNESLLVRHLLNKTADTQQRLFLLTQYLEQFRGTVYRQTMFAEFEKTIHQKVETGESLTPSLLNRLWHELNVKYYGPDVVIDPGFDAEWARIGHFYSQFYVYKYVTGYAAGTAFAGKILTDSEEARRKYIGFLQSGSSDYSLNILKQAGVDLSTPEPLEAAVSFFTTLLDELEELL
jgi:oligoendopeptidase F